MRVLRGRTGDHEGDERVTERMLDRAAADRERVLRVWRPPPGCSFGRRDARSPDYERAREAAADRGFLPVERRTGGRPVAYTGSTVAFILTSPIVDIRDGVAERYDAAAMAVQRALWRLGVPAQRGEPKQSFCPGGPSLQWNGKLAGLAQRIQRNVALVGGIVIVDGRDAIGDVLDPVYDALNVPFDPRSVGSVERAGGDADPETVVRTIEETLLGSRSPTVERVDQEG